MLVKLRLPNRSSRPHKPALRRRPLQAKTRPQMEATLLQRAAEAPGRLSHGALHALQRAIGNQAVGRLLRQPAGSTPNHTASPQNGAAAFAEGSNLQTVLPGLQPEDATGEGGAAFSTGSLADFVQSEAPGADLPPPEQRRLIRMGSQGKEVRYAQERLNSHGATPPLAVDGVFGPLTRQATVEYQESHGLVSDAIIGPRTWASLDGPTAVGKQSGQGKGGAVTPGAGKALKYDTTSYRLTPPPAPTKATPIGKILASIKAALQAKQDQQPPELGKTLNVQGVTPGAPEEVFVWNAMLQLGSSNRWGSEVDLVTDIDWAATTGAKAPVGQITLRIDAQGNATAELIQKGAVGAPVKSQSLDDLKKALKTDFGLTDVKDGSAQWTVEQLNKVYAAFSKMPSSDRAALAGVELVREHSLTDSKGKPLAGKFSHSAQLAVGATTATRSATLSLADSAFAGDDVSFVGDKGDASPASFQTIVHEAGHAVETKALRDAQFATLEAMGANNQAIATLNAKIQDMNSAITAFNSESASASAKAKKYSAADSKAAQGFTGTIGAATRAINTYSQNGTVSRHAKLEADAAAAIANRNSAQTKLATAAPGHPALTDFATAVKRQDEWFAAAQARAKAHIQQQATAATVAEKKKDEKAVTGGPNQSKRLKNFVDVVNKNQIPPLTDYAKDNWPDHPEEFFAEAYSLWLTDRTYLSANAKPLLDWFDKGEHLK
jgi:peptidoglycan hydrolase-like protein with peptidoglycan-binding domain